MLNCCRLDKGLGTREHLLVSVNINYILGYSDFQILKERGQKRKGIRIYNRGYLYNVVLLRKITRTTIKIAHYGTHFENGFMLGVKRRLRRKESCSSAFPRIQELGSVNALS